MYRCRYVKASDAPRPLRRAALTLCLSRESGIANLTHFNPDETDRAQTEKANCSSGESCLSEKDAASLVGQGLVHQPAVGIFLCRRAPFSDTRQLSAADSQLPYIHTYLHLCVRTLIHAHVICPAFCPQVALYSQVFMQAYYRRVTLWRPPPVLLWTGCSTLSALSISGRALSRFPPFSLDEPFSFFVFSASRKPAKKSIPPRTCSPYTHRSGRETCTRSSSIRLYMYVRMQREIYGYTGEARDNSRVSAHADRCGILKKSSIQQFQTLDRGFFAVRESLAIPSSFSIGYASRHRCRTPTENLDVLLTLPPQEPERRLSMSY